MDKLIKERIQAKAKDKSAAQTAFFSLNGFWETPKTIEEALEVLNKKIRPQPNTPSSDPSVKR